MNNINIVKVNDPAIGDYTITINHDNSTVTTIIDMNIFMYSFDKEELISKMLELNLDIDINDFIINFILGDEDLTEYHLKLIKHI